MPNAKSSAIRLLAIMLLTNCAADPTINDFVKGWRFQGNAGDSRTCNGTGVSRALLAGTSFEITQQSATVIALTPFAATPYDGWPPQGCPPITLDVSGGHATLHAREPCAITMMVPTTYTIEATITTMTIDVEDGPALLLDATQTFTNADGMGATCDNALAGEAGLE